MLYLGQVLCLQFNNSLHVQSVMTGKDTYLVKLRKNVQVFFCFSIIAYDIIFHVFITVLKAYIGLFFLKSANSLKLN